MDTEFPGVVARPMGEFKSSTDYHYQLLRCNVDLLKIIQLGVTFMDSEGNLPEGITTWQFNFKFSLTEDMYAEESIELLQKLAKTTLLTDCASWMKHTHMFHFNASIVNVSYIFFKSICTSLIVYSPLA